MYKDLLASDNFFLFHFYLFIKKPILQINKHINKQLDKKIILKFWLYFFNRLFPCLMFTLRSCLIYENEKLKWISYLFSHSFSYLDNLNNNENKINNDSTKNELPHKFQFIIRRKSFDSLSSYLKILFKY